MVYRLSALFQNNTFIAVSLSLLLHLALIGWVMSVSYIQPRQEVTVSPLRITFAPAVLPEPVVSPQMPRKSDSEPPSPEVSSLESVTPPDKAMPKGEANPGEEAMPEIVPSSEPIQEVTTPDVFPGREPRYTDALGVSSREEVVQKTLEPVKPTFETLSSGLNLPRPEYPSAARKWGYEGEVLLAITVKEDGKLERVELLSSSGYDILDREVLRTVQKKWHFHPPGEKVILQKVFEFRLD